MPYIITVIGLQVFCVWHAVKTGRTQPWLFVIVFLPLIGSIAYFLAEILPEFARSRGARKVAIDVNAVLDPEKDFRERQQAVELSGTPAAKAAFGDECARRGMYPEARAMYQSALSGLFADDPHLLLAYAKVLIEQPDYAECRRVLAHLREKNPDFQSGDGHLLYARALEGLGLFAEAAGEFDALAHYYPGFEAKVRYALMLLKQGEVAKSRGMLEGVVHSFKQLPKHAQDLNRDWYNAARKNLEG